MTNKDVTEMIEFHRLRPDQKEAYDAILFACPPRGCEYSFGNLSLWGRQQAAFLHGCVAFFSHFNGRSVYPYPIGSGDKKATLEAIFQDARQRGIPCRLTSMTEDDRAELESLFPGVFSLRVDRDAFDYVYAIDDLADLRGRKFQKKRNHVNRFQAEHPNYQVCPLTAENLPQAQILVNNWFCQRRQADPQGDYLLEDLALTRAFQNYESLGLEGIALVDGGEFLAVTIGSRMGPDTFDIHFEKAREDVEGAYAAVNCEFSRYLRLKYPPLRYLNREDDLGLEGLRKAKLSYNPHHMVEKFWGCRTEDLHED